MARYSLFMLKMPLNTNQPINQLNRCKHRPIFSRPICKWPVPVSVVSRAVLQHQFNSLRF